MKNILNLIFQALHQIMRFAIAILCVFAQLFSFVHYWMYREYHTSEYSTFELFTLQVPDSPEIHITYLYFFSTVLTTFVVWEYYLPKIKGLNDFFSKKHSDSLNE